jgi:hypothetical protein
MELCKFAVWADREARSDLSIGQIKNENDYTSNFTGALRRIINSNSRTGLLATSHLLGKSDENVFGCDAAIVISSGPEVKIALLEAKWPRLKSSSYRWDFAQSSAGLSHFSDQLNRQHKHNGRFAIFEIFYCEWPFKKQPFFMQDDVSSCVWHDSAYNFDKLRPNCPQIWSRTELKDLLKQGTLRIDEILEGLCECRVGEKLQRFSSIQLLAEEFNLSGEIIHIESSPVEASLQR